MSSRYWSPQQWNEQSALCRVAAQQSVITDKLETVPRHEQSATTVDRRGGRWTGQTDRDSYEGLKEKKFQRGVIIIQRSRSINYCSYGDGTKWIFHQTPISGQTRRQKRQHGSRNPLMCDQSLAACRQLHPSIRPSLDSSIHPFQATNLLQQLVCQFLPDKPEETLEWRLC